MFEAFHELSVPCLCALADSLDQGPLSAGLTRQPVNQICGSQTDLAYESLRALLNRGMASKHVALLLRAIAETRSQAVDPAQLLELVLSGPDVPGLPISDTAATIETLIEEAQQEALLVGYAVHNGMQIFRPLAEKMHANRSLRVVLCLDINRRQGDTSLPEEVVRRFCADFRKRHWPWPELPELYYDPRGLEADPHKKGALHAKCVVVDRRAAIVTSANFTEAAQQRNIEVGVLVRFEPVARRLAEYFEALCSAGTLLICPLAVSTPNTRTSGSGLSA